MWPPEQLDLLKALPWLQGLEFFESIGSTNTHALERISDVAVPHLVVAAEQTAGRGRGGHRWWSRPGALMCSLVVDVAGLPRERWPALSLVAGLAAARAAQPLVAGALQLKWPNDLYLNARKLGGILTESGAAAERVVLGFGLNVLNSFAEAPLEQRSAVAMCEHSRAPLELGAVLAGLLDQLHDLLPRYTAGQLDLVAEWTPHCLLYGRQVRLQQGAESVAGKCLGIDASGALRIDAGGGERQCCAGVLTEW